MLGAGQAPAGVKQVAYVLYAAPGAALWHQRWILGTPASCPTDVVWVTPDNRVEWETVDGTSRDISAIRYADTLRPNPPGVGQVYRFRHPPTGPENCDNEINVDDVTVLIFQMHVLAA